MYAIGDLNTLASTIAEYVPGQALSLLPAAHSNADIQDAMTQLGSNGGKLPTGDQVVYAKPARNGSSILVGIAPTSERSDIVRAVENLHLGVPVTAEVATPIEPATRVRNATPFFSGAYMEGPNWACTTGFMVQYLGGGGPSMMSADHCSDAAGETWYNGTTTGAAMAIGVSQGGPLLTTDLENYAGPGGANLTPYVFSGNYMNNATVSPIRGAVLPIVGDSVCYSGSRSGLVCSNNVDAVEALACYAGIPYCYYRTTWTTQTSLVPAAGQGDSGGPVIASVGGQAYAAGIISGMSLPTPFCTGDAGRLCSPFLIYAPIMIATGSGGGYGLYIVP